MIERDRFSVATGCTIHFREGRNRVRLWFSAFSGMQKVFLNDRLVSRKRTFKLDAESRFVIEGKPCSINIVMKSLMNGPIECTLSMEGVPLQRKLVVFGKPGTRLVRNFLPSLLFYLAVVIVLMHFELPVITVMMILVVLVILASLNFGASSTADREAATKVQEQFVEIIEVEIGAPER